jgi:hypothetical protein
MRNDPRSLWPTLIGVGGRYNQRVRIHSKFGYQTKNKVVKNPPAPEPTEVP